LAGNLGDWVSWDAQEDYFVLPRGFFQRLRQQKAEGAKKQQAEAEEGQSGEKEGEEGEEGHSKPPSRSANRLGTAEAGAVPSPTNLRLDSKGLRSYLRSLKLPTTDTQRHSSAESRRSAAAAASLAGFLSPGVEVDVESERQAVAAMREHWQRRLSSAPTSIEQDQALLARSGGDGDGHGGRVPLDMQICRCALQLQHGWSASSCCVRCWAS